MSNSDREESHSVTDSSSLQKTVQTPSESQADNKTNGQPNGQISIGQLDALAIDQPAFEYQNSFSGDNESIKRLSDEQKAGPNENHSTHRVHHSQSNEESSQSDVNGGDVIKSRMDEGFAGNQDAKMSGFDLGHVAAMYKDPPHFESSQHNSSNHHISTETDSESFAGNKPSEQSESGLNQDVNNQFLKETSSEDKSEKKELRAEDSQQHISSDKNDGEKHEVSGDAQRNPSDVDKSTPEEANHEDSNSDATQKGPVSASEEKAETETNAAQEAHGNSADAGQILGDPGTLQEQDPQQEEKTPEAPVHEETSSKEAQQVSTANGETQQAPHEEKSSRQALTERKASEPEAVGSEVPVLEGATQKSVDQDMSEKASQMGDAQSEVSKQEQPESETPATESPTHETHRADQPVQDQSTEKLEGASSVDEPSSESSSREGTAHHDGPPETDVGSASKNGSSERQNDTHEEPGRDNSLQEEPVSKESTRAESVEEEPIEKVNAQQEIAEKEAIEEEPTKGGPPDEESTTEESADQKAFEEALATEEPAAKQPTVEEPATDETTAEDLSAKGLTAEEPTTEEPALQQPTTEEPTVKESATKEPTKEEPTVEEPVKPAVNEPAVEESAKKNTTGEAPTTEEPATEKEELAAEELAAKDSIVKGSAAEEEPTVTEEPTVEEKPITEEESAAEKEPAAKEETGVEEESTTDAPNTADGSITKEHAEEEETTREKPAAEEPTITEESAVEEQPVAQEEPAKEQPDTEESTVTEEPAIEEPAVKEESSVKEEPAAEELATERPTAEEFAKQKTDKEEPSTEEPTTEEPTTEEPTTEEPTTEEPTIEAPTTEEPTLEEPMTEEADEQETTKEPTEEEFGEQETAQKEPAEEQPTTELSAKQETDKEEPAEEQFVKDALSQDQSTFEQSAHDESHQNGSAERAAPLLELTSTQADDHEKVRDDTTETVSPSWNFTEEGLGTRSPTSRFYRSTSAGLNRTKRTHGWSSYQGSVRDDSASDTFSQWRDQDHPTNDSQVDTVQDRSSNTLQILRLTDDTTKDGSSSRATTQNQFDDEHFSRGGTGSGMEGDAYDQPVTLGEPQDESSRRSVRNSVKGSIRSSGQEQPQTESAQKPIPDQPDDYARDGSFDASERTPLLADRNNNPPDDQAEDGSESPSRKSRLPSFIALGVLCVLIILAIVFGFAAPAIVQEYAKQAITFEPKSLSIDSITDIGVRTRVQGVLWLDGAKVHQKSVRDLGRAATWIASKVESGDAEVKIYLPEYEETLTGIAPEYKEALAGIVRLPPVLLDIRDGHKNHIDIVSDLEPGDINVLQKIARDYMDGKRSLDVRAIASVPVQSGILKLGEQHVTQYMRLESVDAPKIPDFDIAGLRVAEYGYPGHPEGLKALAAVTAMNEYPVKLDIPPLSFQVLLPDCADDYLMLGKMSTDWVHILPAQNITTNVTGIVNQLPSALTRPCPGSSKSPLDTFVGKYLAGNDTSIYVRGGDQGEHTPAWIGNLLRATVVPVPVPSHPFDNAIKNFSLSNVHFQLPDSDEGNPKLSATVNVVVGLPKGIDMNVNVSRVRADSDVFFKGKPLGKLDLQKWQNANSTKIGDELHVQSKVVDAPLRITNQEVFTEVIQEIIFRKRGIHLVARATVDVDTTTALGQFVVRRIPGKGEIFIKPVGGAFEHTVKGISVVGSTPEELILEAKVSVKNPTEYSAHVPYVNISVWCNETRLGYAWGSFNVGPGDNDLAVQASWNTGSVGAEFLSQYISGRNTTLELRSHHGSVPGLPDPRLAVNVTVPHLFGRFLKETTMHIWSSTAEFILFSPLPMYVTKITADAYYNGTDIGAIEYDEPFKVDVGDTLTPRLPVAWNTDGGFGLIKDALGGQLKLDAHADVAVRIGQWEETIWYEARGLGAKVRL